MTSALITPPMMKSVHSSHIDSVGYLAELSELWVKWESGKTSIYSGVPVALANTVVNSWSVGKSLRDKIKDKFDHRYAP